MPAGIEPLGGLRHEPRDDLDARRPGDQRLSGSKSFTSGANRGNSASLT